MSKIIFNADDLGWSRGVNQGILKAYRYGVVNSSSWIVTTPYFDETIELIQVNQLANIGIHINLTEGKPLLKNHTTIVDEKGSFIRNLHTLEHIDMKEVHDEIEAQIEKALATGVSINHMDTHHHIHATSKFRKVFISFSNRYQLPLRKINNTVINPIKVLKFYLDTKQAKYYTSHFSADFFASEATSQKLIQILQKNKGRNIEIMCHPGFTDEENGDYNLEREKELAILTSTEMLTFISK